MIPLLRRLVVKMKSWHFVIIYICVILMEYLQFDLLYFVLFMVSYYVGFRQVRIEKIKTVFVMAVFIITIVIRFLAHKFFDETILYNDIIAGVTHHLLAACIILLISKTVKRWGKIANNPINIFIEKHSYSIYIVHYCMIPFLYRQFPLWLATVFFLALTALLAVALDATMCAVYKRIKKA